MDNAQLDAPEFELALDENGRITWPFPSSGFAPQELPIQRLTINDGRATLVDGATSSRLLLDKIEFSGTLRSLIGPLKGDGAFVAAGQRYPYRMSMSRVADDGSVRLRLNLDPTDRPLSADINLSVWINGRVPRFEGVIALARPPGRAAAGAPADAAWRMTSRIKGNSAAAELDQVELQYGPDDAAVRLRGSGKLTLRGQPHFTGALTASQLDLDRILALPEESRRRPAVALKTLADRFSGMPPLPLPVRLAVGIEMLTLAGATIQRVNGQLRTEGESWAIDLLELRAPGLTQVRVNGGFDRSTQANAFKGSVNVNSGDPRALLSWLTDRADPQTTAIGSFRLSGDFSFGTDAIAIDRLNAEIDRMTVLGSFAYSWKGNGRPARLDAELTTPELNIDRVRTLAKAILGDTELEPPRQGAVALKIGRASVGDFEAKQLDAKMRIDSDGLDIDRLEIADLAGIALAVRGRIDTRAQSPRGAVNLKIDAGSLEGIRPLVEKFAPQAADQFRRLAGRLTPVALRGTLTLDPAASSASGTNATANFQLDGRAGSFLVALRGDTGVASDALRIDDSATLAAARVDVSAQLEADDGEALIDLVGLESLFVAERRRGQAKFEAKGPLAGELAVNGRIEVGDLALSAKGTVRASDQKAAALEVDIANANLRSPRPPAPGSGTEVVPASVAFGLALADGTLRLTDVRGTVAGASVAGQLAVELQQQPMSVAGEFEVSTVNLAAAIGMGIGVRLTPGSGARWPVEPFAQGGRRAIGQVSVKARQVELTPALAARNVQGRLHISESQLALQVMEGSVAGGRISGELIFLNEGADVIARTRLKLTDANAAELLPGDGVISGGLALDIALEGTGKSPLALIGALEGNGRITLTKGRLARFDPAALTAAIRAADAGMAIDAARVRTVVESALAKGALPIRRAEAGISIEGGQARLLSNPTLEARDVDLAVVGLVNLAEGVIDARATLSGMFGAATNALPQIVVALKGPIDAPERTIDVTALTSWLALRAIEQQSKKLDALEGRDSGAGAARGAPGRQQMRPQAAYTRLVT